jgi:membrane-associated phospholipid phosphatase
MSTRQDNEGSLPRLLTNLLNPFFIFTALYITVAAVRSGLSGALLYTLPELIAAGLVAGYVLLMRRRARVSDFWISTRAERLIPAIVLLSAFVGLLLALYLMDAPQALFLTTLSIGLAAATVAALTLFWKASAHSAVAGHAAVAGLLLLGPVGLVFVLALPLVIWARVVLKAHTLSQALAGAGIGAAFALVFLA